jgi:DNA-binding transcriptional regulator YdaS (Cro superfamily)
MAKVSGIEKAVALFDNSPTKLAGAIGGRVVRQHVEHWLKVGHVPAEYCPSIERATGGRVRCEDLRTDVAWGVLRMQARVAEPEQKAA